MKQYSNPRLDLTLEGWPHGALRTTCVFRVETHPVRGQRATRQTRHPKTGQWSAPKVNTFADKTRIVDGDDGRTYVLRHCGSHINVQQSNLQFDEENIWPRDERWDAIVNLFN